MQETSLNYLQNYTPWVHRLLGMEDFQPRERSIERVDTEYDKDKYSKCLDYYDHAGRDLTPEDIKQFEFGMAEADEMCISEGERLYLTSLGETRRRYYELLARSMHQQIEASDVVVELGCGYGFNLYMLSQLYPGKQFVGGEYSENAIELARRLFRNHKNIAVEKFNFYDAEYSVLKKLNGRIVVFTSHAIEQIPRAKQIVKTLRNYPAIQIVFHFEPIFEAYSDKTLLGLMRKRYTVVNDYNRDLLSSLQTEGISIIQNDDDVFGLNPLNPTSVVSWEFAHSS